MGSTMAREDVSERGLPSVEERRQILQRAGIILDEARDLVARLDLHECSYPRSMREHQDVLDRVRGQFSRVVINTPALCSEQTTNVLAA
jgi:hypothetical protein